MQKIITCITKMHVEIVDTYIPVQYSIFILICSNKRYDNLYYRIHHNLTKKCWFMLDFVFQSPFLNIH